MSQPQPRPIFSLMQTQQLSGLLETVDQLTTASISKGHKPLVEEIRSAAARIEQLTVAESQNALIEELVKTFDEKQKAIFKALDPPLSAIQKLTESGYLQDAQKTTLLLQLARTYELLARWDRALDLYYNALDYCQDDATQKARMLKGIGRIKSKQRDYGEANNYYRASLKLYLELEDSYQIAQVYINIGFNEFQADNYAEAEANYLQALKIGLATAGAERMVADAQMTLGILETVRGNFEEALAFYQQSLYCYQELDDERGIARAYYNIAMMHVDLKAWKEAGESYQKSLESAQRLGDLHLLGLIYLSQTELGLKLGDLALALACCMHAIKTFGQTGSQAQLSEAYKYLGQIQHRKGNSEKSDLFFHKSIELAKACESQLNLAEAHYEYGLCLLEKPDLDNARIQLNEALTLFTALEAQADIENTQAALDRLAESEKTAGQRSRFVRIN